MKLKLINIFLFFTIYSIAQSNNEINFSLENGFIYIDSIYVNSKEKSNSFILDTGSEMTVLDKKFALGIFKKDCRKIFVEDITGESKKQESIIIDSLKFGNQSYYNIRVLILDLPSKVEGIIGCNLLSKHIWNLDYMNKRITPYSDISELKTLPKYLIPFKLKKGIPNINIMIGKTKIRNVRFDTGNVNKFSLKIKDSIKLNNELVNYSYHTFYKKTFNDDFKKITILKSGLYKKIKLGNYLIDSLNANYTGTRTFGNGLFKNSNIIIDFINNNLYFNHLKPIKNPYIGCWFEITNNGKIKVSSLTKNSPAYKIGIKLGDELIYCNNYENIHLLKKSIIDGSFYKFKTKEIILKMKKWENEKKIHFKN